MPRPSWTSETFWNKVKRGTIDECWEWQGRLNTGKRSYGCLYGRVDIFGKKGVYVHRVAFFLSNPGTIELERGNGLFVLHRCDNTKCCNPKHLFLGTHEDNMADKIAKGRQHSFRSVDSPNAKFTAKDVLEIREAHKRGVKRKVLAEKYKVHLTAIKCVISRRTYKDID